MSEGLATLAHTKPDYTQRKPFFPDQNRHGYGETVLIRLRNSGLCGDVAAHLSVIVGRLMRGFGRLHRCKRDPWLTRNGTILWLTLMAWLAMLGFDFIWHAGLLARLYVQPSPFLLPLPTSFTLIPVGYLSFLLLAVLLVWLMRRLKLVGWRNGAIFGMELGGLAWGAFVLGLLSISTASVALLMGWFIGQTLELAIAGAVAGSGLASMRLRRLLGVVIVFVLLSVITTIILQSLGVVPATRIS